MPSSSYAQSDRGAGEAWNDAVVVALGSNLGLGGLTPVQVLEQALARFGPAGLRVQRRSRWWRAAAWPDPAEPPYVNAVALVQTQLAPAGVLQALQAIEAEFGRVRGRRNAPRALDLDLIAHGRQVLAGPELTLPHPRAADRKFVMGPLAEIAPGWRHPVSGATAAALAQSAAVGQDAAPLAS